MNFAKIISISRVLLNFYKLKVLKNKSFSIYIKLNIFIINILNDKKKID
jgi:hypothetical protein